MSVGHQHPDGRAPNGREITNSGDLPTQKSREITDGSNPNPNPNPKPKPKPKPKPNPNPNPNPNPAELLL